MLNRAERFEILTALRWYCIFGLLPAQVDLLRWELLSLANPKRIWICRLSYVLLILRAIFNLGTLARECFLETETPLHEISIHAVWAVCVPVYICWYYMLYMENFDAFASYFKMTFVGNIQGTAAWGAPRRGQKKRSWSRRFKECTPQDLTAMIMPYIVLSGGATMMLAYIWHPSMKLLLYAYLPETCQTWITFGFLLLDEWRTFIAALAVALPTWILQILSIDLINNQVKSLIDSMQRSTGNGQVLGHAYKSLRRIQLYVGIVNQVNCYIIFSWKCLCLTCCIGTGYAAIAHFSDYPVFGVMYYLILVDSIILYTFSFDKAFKVPDLFEKAATRAMLLGRNGNAESVKIFKLQMRSMPRMGIKVGSFHMMERESTPTFIHFVLDNIVSLLVATRPA